MALRTNTFEGGTDGVTVTTGNSGGSSGDAFDLVTTAAGAITTFSNISSRDGLALRVSSGSAATNSRVQWTQTLSTDFTRGYYFLDGASNPTSDAPIIGWRTVADSAGARISFLTTGVLQIQDSAFATAGSMTTILPIAAWFRVECNFTPGAGTGSITVRLYLTPESTAPNEILTLTSKQFGADLGRTYFGISTSTTNVPSTTQSIYIDNIVSGATTWPGPAQLSNVYIPKRMPLGV